MEVAELDAMPTDACIAAMAPWFEGAPRFLERLVAARPFGDEATLFGRAEAIALAMPEAEQLELIDAHPRLGAPPATVSDHSFREQGYDRETADAMADLARLNDAYERRFGFRYCVFVAGRTREELIPEWEERLASGDRVGELRRALRDVVAIGRDRYRRLRAEAEEVAS